MSSENKKYPWKNGYWLEVKERNSVTFVEGENVENINHVYLDYPDLKPEQSWDPELKGKWTYGDFGPAPAEIVQMSGRPNFNIQVQYSGEGNCYEITYKLVLNEEGTRIYGPGFFPYQKYIKMEWLNEQKLNEYKESRQPADAPICPYAKLQPGNLGKIVWFSGPPGSGKSSSAQMLGRKHGFVFYEGDCIMQSLNPFIDLNVEEPTMVQNQQTPLKGIPKDQIIIRDGLYSIDWSKPDEWDMEEVNKKLQDFCELMANDILKQRNRIGGDWSVAFACFSRHQREIIRKILGPDVIFIVMSLTRETTMKRLQGRFGEDENGEQFTNQCLAIYKKYEEAGDDEMNSYNLMIDENMSIDDVDDKVMDIIHGSNH